MRWFWQTPAALTPAREEAITALESLQGRIKEERTFWHRFTPFGYYADPPALSPASPQKSHDHVWEEMQRSFEDAAARWTACLKKAMNVVRNESNPRRLVEKLDVVLRDMTYAQRDALRGIKEVERLPANPAVWDQIERIVQANRSHLSDPAQEKPLRKALASPVSYLRWPLPDFLCLLQLYEREGSLDEFLRETKDELAEESRAVARALQTQAVLQSCLESFEAIIEALRTPQ